MLVYINRSLYWLYSPQCLYTRDLSPSPPPRKDGFRKGVYCCVLFFVFWLSHQHDVLVCSGWASSFRQFVAMTKFLFCLHDPKPSLFVILMKKTIITALNLYPGIFKKLWQFRVFYFSLLFLIRSHGFYLLLFKLIYF